MKGLSILKSRVSSPPLQQRGTALGLLELHESLYIVEAGTEQFQDGKGDKEVAKNRSKVHYLESSSRQQGTKAIGTPIEVGTDRLTKIALTPVSLAITVRKILRRASQKGWCKDVVERVLAGTVTPLPMWKDIVIFPLPFALGSEEELGDTPAANGGPEHGTWLLTHRKLK
ncbi:hypothetical protein BT69DRAFT_1304302 [Atractiella rhizophila]|nr:hypothetical protein BT69DRAFT_1304302 [Atractiella rhizophila]